MKIIYKKTNKLSPLFCQYDGQYFPQKAYIEIDFKNQTIDADYSGQIGNAVPAKVFHDVVHRLEINPQINEEALIRKMEEILPTIKEAAKEYEVIWKNGNEVGKFSDKARDLLMFDAQNIVDDLDYEDLDPEAEEMIKVAESITDDEYHDTVISLQEKLEGQDA